MCLIHYPYCKCCFLRSGWSLMNFHLEISIKIYSCKLKKGFASKFDLLWGWLIWVGESIEPGELTDRGRDDKFISFAWSFCCCCSCVNWKSNWMICPISDQFIADYSKNFVPVQNLHGSIGVNHLEYNLPLTRGAYHTDLDSKNSCYNKLNITL